MRSSLIAFSFGCVLVAYLPQLTFWYLVVGLTILAAVVVLRWRLAYGWLVGLFGLTLGCCWGVSYGLIGLAELLPKPLERQPLLISGYIVGLPQHRDHGYRFDFKVTHIEVPKQPPGTNDIFMPDKVRLYWYQQQPSLAPGQYWQLLVKLKRPHGFASPGAFDYEGYLLQLGIDATGYVRESQQNQLLGCCQWLTLFDQWRWKLKQHYTQQLSGESLGLLLALLLGDQTAITPNQWDALNKTGTTHLVVVSGLHIGLCAVLGALLASVLVKLQLLPLIVTAREWAIGAGWILATGYALLSGFQLPVQRAWVMLTIGAVAFAGRWQFQPLSYWWVALAFVLLWQPLAVVSAGFWYSFVAVAALLVAFSHRRAVTGVTSLWIKPQWIVWIALLPLFIHWQQVSVWYSPLINLLVIPLLGFVIMPALLVAVLLASFSAFGWTCLKMLNQGLAAGVELLAQLSAGEQTTFALTPLGVLLFALAWLLPAGLPGRSGLIMVGVLVGYFKPEPPSLEAGQFRLTLFDVGQGLGALIETKNHRLIYDTGPQWNPRFSAVGAVIIPFLKQQQINHLDKLIISHADQDHSGGLKELSTAVFIDGLESGTATEIRLAQPVQPCQAGQSWQWDGVVFRYLAGTQGKDRNERSCVLQVMTGNHQLLLTGDISAKQERQLVTQWRQQLKSSVLVAAHHGSYYATSVSFIKQVKPSVVLFSAGYQNRYGHPNKKLVKRLQQSGILTYNTADEGSIQWLFDKAAEPALTMRYRLDYPRYWSQKVSTRLFGRL
ncbi:DNA internalization-related competence protein ComEC/Rec2 [Endozoicomonas sp. SM1973]|uniref:DNA internalization-related competence protein ComEC/Rec2 n=1 Tax=Spartinivicinus marinus TaxID=2994442 RepID=A0A853I4B1_9GAMM|nr:DNA internalization-related competence protein ComEC/Rec2 [Spartinivicinus marinus]MCX4029420.1 DNA internalization-related competence protein ComEC/Rec2 [Spartinivicinus marinus]NYZ64994.1 DNA internalization-related competence protein ComEC/Rec2 [Spartinivicinus marinus]